jgi:hypothetical protein
MRSSLRLEFNLLADLFVWFSIGGKFNSIYQDWLANVMVIIMTGKKEVGSGRKENCLTIRRKQTGQIVL